MRFLMSSFLPAPLMIVVLSFSTRTVLALPSCSSVTFSSLRPRSSLMNCAAGQDGDVAEHGLAAVAEAGRLDGTDLQDAAQLVDHQHRQRFALDVLGDDEQRLAGLADLFQERQHVADVGQLLLVDEDVAVFQLGLHVLGVGDEVGRNVALVELHALDELERGFGGLAFLDGDDAVLADLLEGVGHQLADGRVVVGADAGDLLHLFLLGQPLGHAFQVLDDGFDGLVDAALDGHRIGAGGDVAQAFLIDGQGQDGRGGGAVAGHVAGLLGDGVDQLGAHVLERVGQVDFLADGDAVLGDGRAAEDSCR